MMKLDPPARMAWCRDCGSVHYRDNRVGISSTEIMLCSYCISVRRKTYEGLWT